MNVKHNIKNKILYYFNNSLDKGTFYIIIWLTLALTFIVTIASIILIISNASQGLSFFENLILLAGKTLEYEQTDANSLTYEFINFVIFLTGLFVSATLIGAITTGLSDKLDSIRQSKSLIIEENHTIILGWSNHVISIVNELILANESEAKCIIVILGRIPKSEMLATIQENCQISKKVKIICREGDRRFKRDLEQLSLNTAKNIIINQYSHETKDVSKSLLAILNRANRKKERYHIVTSVSQKEDSQLCKVIGRDEVEIIEPDDFLARLEAQTTRQPGLPIIYEDFFNFDGDEIYFKSEKSLFGKTFGECISSYNSTSIIGLSTNDKVLLNPSFNRVYKKGEELIGIAEDDSTFVYDKVIQKKKILNNINKRRDKALPEKFLFLGFNHNTNKILENLGDYVPSGSICNLYSNVKNLKKIKKFKKLTVNYFYTESINRKFLEKLKFNDINNVTIQSTFDETEENDFDEIDTQTLSILINLRDLRKIKNESFKIVCELFDTNNHDLIQNDEVDDFILSEKIISSVLAQIAENKKLADVFRELFVPEGSEIYLKPITNYVNVNKKINFYELVETAKLKNEIAIGYRLERYSKVSVTKINNKLANFGIILNPYKNDYVDFSKGDSIIVLSDN